MGHPRYRLDLTEARAVLEAMREVCVFRDWRLLAAHVRATHVHAVVDRVVLPNRAIAAFKAYASRALNRLERRQPRWAREGSTRSLPTEAAIRAAVRYVADRQGEPMAVYVLDRYTAPDVSPGIPRPDGRGYSPADTS